jgi:cytochrome c-type biogenesis protein CcmH
MFPVAAILMLMGVIAFLAFPFWRRSQMPLIVGHEASLDEERVDLEIERQALIKILSELEIDSARGNIGTADYSRLKLSNEHRLVTVLDRLELLTQKEPAQGRAKTLRSDAPSNSNWLIIPALGILIAIGSAGIYKLVYWKFEQQQFAAAAKDGGIGAPPPINPAEMVARLEERLKKNPNDLQGQLMIGRSYMAMERWGDAEKAWRKVIELDDRNETAHYSLGEVLIRTNPPGNRPVAEEALAHFDKALIRLPQDASILWARGIALIQLERYPEADETWTQAFQYIPQGTESSEMVKKALQDLRAGRIPLS